MSAMRIHDAGRACLVLVAALVACAGGAEPRPEATSTQAASTPAADETTEPAAAEETTEPAAAETSAVEPPPDTSVEPSPTCFTRVWFDLRAMPHRGPRDVDARLVSGRVELLAQRVRDAAGEPAPRFLMVPGASVFRAEFFGTDAEALSQCQRAVDAVARGDVRATPCARLEP
jgi:hypothetical protein